MTIQLRTGLKLYHLHSPCHIIFSTLLAREHFMLVLYALNLLSTYCSATRVTREIKILSLQNTIDWLCYYLLDYNVYQSGLIVVYELELHKHQKVLLHFMYYSLKSMGNILLNLTRVCALVEYLRPINVYLIAECFSPYIVAPIL